MSKISPYYKAGLGGSVGCTSNWWSGGHGFDPTWSGNIIFMEIDYEMFSTAILSFPLMQEPVVSFWQNNDHKYWLTT